MKYDRPSMYSSPVNRSRLTVKHDRPSKISTPMNSTVHQFTVDKYKLKVDNQNHKNRFTAKHERTSIYSILNTVHKFIVKVVNQNHKIKVDN